MLKQVAKLLLATPRPTGVPAGYSAFGRVLFETPGLNSSLARLEADRIARGWPGGFSIFGSGILWFSEWPTDALQIRTWTRQWAQNVAIDPDSDVHDQLAAALGANTYQLGPPDFARIEMASPLGRLGARPVVASLQMSDPLPQERLLSAACQKSLKPALESKALDEELAKASRNLDPLWAALARHLARCSDTEDRRLLTERVEAAHCEDTPLGWGLRYIVRGDVLLDDGGVLTLDELSDLHNLPRLPLLEEMPDELEIERDDDEAEKT